MAKDTVYRFLNSVHTNWRRFLLLLSSRVISQELEPLTGAANMKVLIADDTLYRRNRSKQVELLSRVFDHTDKRYYRGFRMLTLGWSDSISFLPVSCALLASSKEKNRLVPLRTDLDRRTNGARRRREGIRKACRDDGRGPCKRDSSQSPSVRQLVCLSRNHEELACQGDAYPRTKKWLALLSTDTSLDDEQVIMAYKRRWDIEVFCKMAKSFLNLAKECQGRSYDALVAHTAVVCCRYIMLALAKRTNKDPRTLGSLFYACCEELQQATFAEALALVLVFLEQAMGAATEITRELIRSLVERFLKELPPIYGARLLLEWQNNAASC